MTIVADPISNLSPETVRLLEFLVYLESHTLPLYERAAVSQYGEAFRRAKDSSLIVFRQSEFSWKLSVYGCAMLKDFRKRGVI